VKGRKGRKRGSERRGGEGRGMVGPQSKIPGYGPDIFRRLLKTYLYSYY